jgi:hypothetical protein
MAKRRAARNAAAQCRQFGVGLPLVDPRAYNYHPQNLVRFAPYLHAYTGVFDASIT